MFTVNLHDKLPNHLRSEDENEALVDELRDTIQATQALAEKYTPQSSNGRYLDQTGTSLWNLCTGLRRQVGDQTQSSSTRRVLTLARILAFHLLDTVRNVDKDGVGDITRLLKVALKGAQTCICTPWDLILTVIY